MANLLEVYYKINSYEELKKLGVSVENNNNLDCCTSNLCVTNPPKCMFISSF